MALQTFSDGEAYSSVRNKINSNFNILESERLINTVIVNSASDFGTIDSSKVYFLDGVIDMGTTSLVVPTTGITIIGSSFDVSGLTSSEDNYTLFTSE